MFAFHQFVCTDISTRLAESTILQKHMIAALPGVRDSSWSSILHASVCARVCVFDDLMLFQCTTAAMECLRQYLSELLDFIADMHTLTKLKVFTQNKPHIWLYSLPFSHSVTSVSLHIHSELRHRYFSAVKTFLSWLVWETTTLFELSMADGRSVCKTCLKGWGYDVIACSDAIKKMRPSIPLYRDQDDTFIAQ